MDPQQPDPDFIDLNGPWGPMREIRLEWNNQHPSVEDFIPQNDYNHQPHLRNFDNHHQQNQGPLFMNSQFPPNGGFDNMEQVSNPHQHPHQNQQHPQHQQPNSNFNPYLDTNRQNLPSHPRTSSPEVSSPSSAYDELSGEEASPILETTLHFFFDGEACGPRTELWTGYVEPTYDEETQDRVARTDSKTNELLRLGSSGTSLMISMVSGYKVFIRASHHRDLYPQHQENIISTDQIISDPDMKVQLLILVHRRVGTNNNWTLCQQMYHTFSHNNPFGFSPQEVKNVCYVLELVTPTGIAVARTPVIKPYTERWFREKLKKAKGGQSVHLIPLKTMHIGHYTSKILQNNHKVDELTQLNRQLVREVHLLREENRILQSQNGSWQQLWSALIKARESHSQRQKPFFNNEINNLNQTFTNMALADLPPMNMDQLLETMLDTSWDPRLVNEMLDRLNLPIGKISQSPEPVRMSHTASSPFSETNHHHNTNNNTNNNNPDLFLTFTDVPKLQSLHGSSPESDLCTESSVSSLTSGTEAGSSSPHQATRTSGEEGQFYHRRSRSPSPASNTSRSSPTSSPSVRKREPSPNELTRASHKKMSERARSKQQEERRFRAKRDDMVDQYLTIDEDEMDNEDKTPPSLEEFAMENLPTPPRGFLKQFNSDNDLTAHLPALSDDQEQLQLAMAMSLSEVQGQNSPASPSHIFDFYGNSNTAAEERGRRLHRDQDQQLQENSLSFQEKRKEEKERESGNLLSRQFSRLTNNLFNNKKEKESMSEKKKSKSFNLQPSPSHSAMPASPQRKNFSLQPSRGPPSPASRGPPSPASRVSGGAAPLAPVPRRSSGSPANFGGALPPPPSAPSRPPPAGPSLASTQFQQHQSSISPVTNTNSLWARSEANPSGTALASPSSLGTSSASSLSASASSSFRPPATFEAKPTLPSIGDFETIRNSVRSSDSSSPYSSPNSSPRHASDSGHHNSGLVSIKTELGTSGEYIPIKREMSPPPPPMASAQTWEEYFRTFDPVLKQGFAPNPHPPPPTPDQVILKANLEAIGNLGRAPATVAEFSRPVPPRLASPPPFDNSPAIESLNLNVKAEQRNVRVKKSEPVPLPRSPVSGMCAMSLIDSNSSVEQAGPEVLEMIPDSEKHLLHEINFSVGTWCDLCHKMLVNVAGFECKLCLVKSCRDCVEKAREGNCQAENRPPSPTPRRSKMLPLLLQIEVTLWLISSEGFWERPHLVPDTEDAQVQEGQLLGMQIINHFQYPVFLTLIRQESGLNSMTITPCSDQRGTQIRLLPHTPHVQNQNRLQIILGHQALPSYARGSHYDLSFRVAVSTNDASWRKLNPLAPHAPAALQVAECLFQKKVRVMRTKTPEPASEARAVQSIKTTFIPRKEKNFLPVGASYSPSKWKEILEGAQKETPPEKKI